MKLSEVDEALAYSRHSLDEDWERQRQLSTTIGDAHEDAIRRRDGKKQEIEEVSAGLDKIIREEHTKVEAKITETALKNKITLHPQMKRLEQELLDLNLEVGKWAARREAVRMRNDALKGLTSLHGQNYFVSDGAGRENREAANRAADAIRSQTGARYRRERRTE